MNKNNTIFYLFLLFILSSCGAYKDIPYYQDLNHSKPYGDVQKPNVYTLQNERTTITQALSLAGDLNITAMRKNMMLVREIDGKRNYIPIDLTSKNIFRSPYYYLKNNDEIYVQPDRIKYAPLDVPQL